MLDYSTLIKLGAFPQDSVSLNPRLNIQFLHPLKSSSIPEGQDVVQGLIRFPKVLPPRYFYDDHGSQLFEQICDLPEYYPTRTEAWILQHYATAIAQLTGACQLLLRRLNRTHNSIAWCCGAHGARPTTPSIKLPK